MSKIKSALVATVAILAIPAMAHAAKEKAVNNMSDVGREAVAMYDKLEGHKAMAMADDGAVGYSSGVDVGEARIAALARCAEVTRETCRVVSVDGQAVAAGTTLGEVARSHADAADLRGEVVADYEKAQGAKALAMSEDGAFGWVVRETEEEARAAALQQCELQGSGCTLQASAPAGTATN